MPDKYKALWVSHSSISDFLLCPRSYYLNNIYKDNKTGRKISIINPPLSLGSVVHNVLESLSVIKLKKRFGTPLLDRYEKEWAKVSGEKGGFKNENEELEFKNRGIEMLKKVEKDPKILLEKAIKIREDLPQYFISEDKEIMLCGKIDWLKYNEEDDSVDIMDFKTGKNKEDPSSMQLGIYRLLVENCQDRKVNQAGYWYLESGEIVYHDLPSSKESYDRVMEVALKMKDAKLSGIFECPRGGCFACNDLEKVVAGKAKFVGIGGYGKNMYIIND